MAHTHSTPVRRSAFQRIDWPFLTAAFVYMAVCAALLAVAWHRAQGHFIYPLDDVYINMAVAKNFALHAVWGVSPFAFSSSTSSPFYILVLAAAYRLFGVNQGSPLVLSLAFGLAALLVAAGMVRALSPRLGTFTLLGFVLLTPLFAVGTLGMEHALHLLLALLFVRDFDSDGIPLWRIACVTALLTGTRYEGILMAAVATLLLLVDYRWLRATIIAIAAWVPPAIYAIFSLHHGGYWLPNSVAIKGIRLSDLSLAERLHGIVFVTLHNIARGPHVAFLIAALGIMAAALWKSDRLLARALALVAGTGLLHLATADVGWAFRYEAYLIGVAVIVFALAIPQLRVTRPVLVIAAAVPLSLAVIVLMLRTYLAVTLLPEYSRAIYLQQWQTARFLTANYPGESIAANDIGAINYQADLHTLDLAGLASASVFEAKRADDYTTDVIAQLGARDHVQIAVAYDDWFSDNPPFQSVLNGPPLPSSWIRVRRWSVPEKQQLGSKTISWYALSPVEAAILRERLLRFEPSLPKEITVSN